jgi:septum formation protein
LSSQLSVLESNDMLILASNSPRRKELLQLAGWDFIIRAAEIDESVAPGETPVEYVRRLAESKAQRCLENLTEVERAETVILAADTTVVDLVGAGDSPRYEILGKPADADEAESMLRRLRGRSHQVFTGVAVLRAHDRQGCSETVCTDVPMRAYSDDEMNAYIRSGDPLDKAGAYGIQHRSFHPVEPMMGCYPNVMGLPVCRVARLLVEMGLPPGAPVLDECELEQAGPCLVYRLATNEKS